MPTYMVITYLPAKQGLMGPLSERYTMDSCEVESIDEVEKRLHVPLNAEVYVVDKNDVTTFRSRVVVERTS